MPFRAALFCLALATGVAAAQTPTGPVPVPADLATFFSGDWRGAGHFASGKAIEADVNFALDLDGQWLRYRHTDRAPNRYKALGMWGIDSTSGALTMTVNDNFGGARSFTSSGWADGAVTFTRVAPATKEERFIFQRLAADRFTMRYEVRTGAEAWRMVDTVEFARAAP